MRLTTRYLGLELRNPLIASPSPLTGTVEGIQRLAAAGVGAIVLPSLFEEELTDAAARNAALVDRPAESFPEALSYFPTAVADEAGPGRCLRLIERAAGRVDVPVIASLNGATPEGWTGYARSMQDAGAAAIELNVYLLPGDPGGDSRELARRHLEILALVKDAVTVPVAVKLAPHLSSIAELAAALDGAGADGLVLFNRLVAPDIDIDTLATTPAVTLSAPFDARLPRAWIALLRGHLRGSLAASTGVDGADDVIKYLLAGADVVMSTSALLRHGSEHVTALLDGLTAWMRRRGLGSVDELRGLLAVPAGADEAVHQRSLYVEALRAANAGLYSPW